MFNEDDRVVHKIKLDHGTVLEIDDGIAYLEMDNGVEMDFPLSDLMLEADYKSPQDIRRETIAAATIKQVIDSEEIWPKIRPVLVSMTSLYAESTSMAVVALGGTAEPWDKMTDYHKMNFLCVLTKTKFDDWVAAKDVGKLGDLQLLIMTQIGMEITK